ncbi:hypothetical protein FQR65_LT09168 [Abscondita terminalis]|nr:hypothetical protein FQR65_LT09168 [Abscondita terminalis]
MEQGTVLEIDGKLMHYDPTSDTYMQVKWSENELVYSRKTITNASSLNNVAKTVAEFEDTQEPFSGGSSDEVHSSDFSMVSDSSNSSNPGYLEV